MRRKNGMNDKALLCLIEEYVDSLKLDHTKMHRNATPELSYRPTINKFFNDIKKFFVSSAVVIFEPSSQRNEGRPDWLFCQDPSGIYGYAEAKNFDPVKILDWKRHQKQISRYLSLGSKVMLTDGIDFFLFAPRKTKPKHLALVKKPLDRRSWRPVASADQVWSFFSYFFQNSEPQLVNDVRLIGELAIRSKHLADDIESLVRLRPNEGQDVLESATISALGEIKKTMTTEYDASLSSNERFSKSIAQILIFGAFYAHRHLCKSGKPADLRDRISRFWTGDITTDSENRLKPFRALAAILDKYDRPLHGINYVYSDCLSYLSYIRLSKSQQETPDYHKLYEKFLEKFDPKDKIDFGAYATPAYLARFMIDFSEYVSNIVFGRSVFMRDNKIIEPCCGTGTFLEEVVKKATAQNIPKRRFPTVAGFEILAAPYALSQYRLYQLRDQYPLAAHVNMFLCNTLSDKIVSGNTTPKSPPEQKTLFDWEIREAAKMATPPITLVVGNPPSSDASARLGNSHDAISHIMEDFRPPIAERKSRQNTQKQIKNDFIHFLRWSCYKVENDERGIIACVLPSSLLQHSSYQFARKWIFQNFSDIWIIEFDRDARADPSSPNIFKTLQGRCVIFCAKTDADKETTIRYASIMNEKISDRKKWFASMRKEIKRKSDIEKFFVRVTQSDSGRYLFKPVAAHGSSQYDQFWNLTSSDSKNGIFMRHSSGIKLGMTAALTHLDHGQLSRRMRDIGDADLEHDHLNEKWFRGQVKPPSKRSTSGEIRFSIQKAASGKQNFIKAYSFRPFINSFVFLHEDTLRKAERSGGGTRRRPEVLAAFSNDDNPGISIAPSPLDLDSKMHRFSSFCWNLPDNDLCKRGNGHIFCAAFPMHKPTGKNISRWNSSNKDNINPLLLQALARHGVLSTDVLFYVYAILSSTFFLNEFEGALYTTGTWPKIPIFDGPTFHKLASLGRQIAECEKGNHSPTHTYEILPCDGIRLKKYKIDVASGSIVLYSEDSKRYIITNLDSKCLKHSISGYRVFSEWLKRNKWAYLNRNFTNQDVSTLHSINDALLEQFKLIKRADRVIKDALKSQKLIEPPHATIHSK